MKLEGEHHFPRNKWEKFRLKKSERKGIKLFHVPLPLHALKDNKVKAERERERE